MTLPVEMVVAAAENGVIGAGGGMPWRLSTDLKRFRDLTMGRPMVMGRKTFESIGKALPGRTSIVVTRDRHGRRKGQSWQATSSTALELARSVATATGAPSIAIIGGGEIFRLTAPICDRLHLTRVHARPDGDTAFALPDESEWTQTSRDFVPAGPKDTADTTYEVWERRSPSS